MSLKMTAHRERNKSNPHSLLKANRDSINFEEYMLPELMADSSDVRSSGFVTSFIQSKKTSKRGKLNHEVLREQDFEED